MKLTSLNCTNPFLWGKDLKYVIDGQLVDPLKGIVIQIPKEFDFFNLWCNKDKENAREYYSARNA